MMIHNNPGWNNLTRKGTAFIVVPYKNVDFELFRNDVNHFLRVQPQGPCQAEIINEFNELLRVVVLNFPKNWTCGMGVA